MVLADRLWFTYDRGEDDDDDDETELSIADEELKMKAKYNRPKYQSHLTQGNFIITSISPSLSINQLN